MEQMDNASVREDEEPEKKQKSRRPPSTAASGRASGREQGMLMIWHRYRFPTTATEGVAAHPHPQDRTPPLLRRRHYIRAHRRLATVGEREGAGDQHRLLHLLPSGTTLRGWDHTSIWE